MIADASAPQTVESMQSQLELSRTTRRRDIIRDALDAGPGTEAWSLAEVELAEVEAAP